MINLNPSLPSRDMLWFRIRGCGNLVSFKNSKMIARGRLITDPKKQVKMEAYINAIVSDLLFAFQTHAAATRTVCLPPSAIASLLPADDCWQWIPETTVSVIKVEPGQEGADIILERIP